MITIARAVVVLVAVVVLQLALFDGMRIEDVAPEFALAVAIAAGLTGGSDRGSLMAFGIGLTLDLFLASPLGLSALSFSVVAFAAGMMSDSVSETSWVAAAPVIAVGTVIGLSLFVGMGYLLGQDDFISTDLWRVFAIAATANLVLGALGVKLMRWVWGKPESSAIPSRPLGLVN